MRLQSASRSLSSCWRVSADLDFDQTSTFSSKDTQGLNMQFNWKWLVPVIAFLALLCANSAIGRNFVQLFCLKLTETEACFQWYCSAVPSDRQSENRKKYSTLT